ncbi:MAG TPA: hypothetical protein VN328_07605 [Thermodesulfovibrionales bacterium]|nr:hypothetical protein [Thermodesulfovibrionales bacterium]
MTVLRTGFRYTNKSESKATSKLILSFRLFSVFRRIPGLPTACLPVGRDRQARFACGNDNLWGFASDFLGKGRQGACLSEIIGAAEV